MLQFVHGVSTRFLLKQAGVKADGADSGALTLTQGFGSAANSNTYLHGLGLDGVCRRAQACAGCGMYSTPLVMSPRDLMQRLAALMPRPRLHLIQFHGRLAPNAKLRALVLPQEARAPAQAAPPAQCESNGSHRRAVRLSGVRLVKRVFRMDMAHGLDRGGQFKIFAAILGQPVFANILAHMRLQVRVPPGAPIRRQALRLACRRPVPATRETLQHGLPESTAREGMRDR